MARSRVSRGMDAFFACSTTRRRRGFMSGSAPLRAAIMISLDSLPNVRPLAFAAASLCFAFHCAPMLILVCVRVEEVACQGAILAAAVQAGTRCAACNLVNPIRRVRLAPSLLLRACFHADACELQEQDFPPAPLWSPGGGPEGIGMRSVVDRRSA